jgi:excisionase family DNA binding protein
MNQWISVSEAGAYAHLSGATIRRALAAARMRGVKVNGSRVWRTTREWVDEWLHAQDPENGQ